MSDPHENNPPVTANARAPKTWDFMETTFVALVAYAVFGVAGWLTYALFATTVVGPDSLTQKQALFGFYQAATVIACGPTIAVLWVAIRMAGREFSEYLALNWPSRDELVRALMIISIIWIMQHVSQSVIPPTSDTASPFSANAGGLFILFVGLSITGPLMEEFLVRGFMFRGWSESFLGPIAVIALTSLVWAASHTDQDLFSRFWIFVLGIALGYFRWRNNSTWLT